MIFDRKVNFVGSRALIYSIRFVTLAIQYPQTMSSMTGYIDNLLYETVVPIITVTPFENQLIDNDSIEFIRRLESVRACENDFSVRYHMLDLVQTLCSYQYNK